MGEAEAVGGHFWGSFRYEDPYGLVGPNGGIQAGRDGAGGGLGLLRCAVVECVDGLPGLGHAKGEAVEEAEAAGEHHVAVGGGGVGVGEVGHDGVVAGAGDDGELGVIRGRGDVVDAVTVGGEDGVLGECALLHVRDHLGESRAGDFAGVVFEDGVDVGVGEGIAEGVHVADVEDEASGTIGDGGVVEGAEGGGGAVVHDDGGHIEGGATEDGAGAGEVVGEVVGGEGEGAWVGAGGEDAFEVREAEESVGLAVDGGVQAEGAEGGPDGIKVEVTQGDGVGVELREFVVGDEGDAVGLEAVEVVVEGAGGVGGGVGGEAGLEVVGERPVAGTAAGGDAVEGDGVACPGGVADVLCGDDGGGGHDEFGGVFDRLGGVEKQDVLGAGADVDGEDAHAGSVRAEWVVCLGRRGRAGGRG